MKKGVGLLSLIMYIIGLTIVIAIITTFNYNIFDATNKFTDISRIDEQYTKFNMFFINTVKQANYAKYGETNSIIEFYDKDDNIIATYTYDSTNRKIVYTDLNQFTEGFDVCQFIDPDFSMTLSNEFQTGKYHNVTIGGNPMFKLNKSASSFVNVTYVIGRGY